MRLLCSSMLIFTLLVFSCSSLAFKNQRPSYCPEPLTLAYYGDWYPYIFTHGNKILGSDWELLKMIIEQLGCEISLKIIPEKRAHQKLSNYSIVMIAATITPQRLKQAYFSKPYRDEMISIFYLDASPSPNKQPLEQLVANLNVIVINGAAWYGDKIESLRSSYKERKFLHVHSLKRRIDMVTKNRAQAFVEDHIAGCDHFYQYAPEKTKQLQSLVVNQNKVSFMFSRKAVTEEFIKKFNQLLTEKLAQGIYQDLVATYTPTACIQS